MLIDLLYGDSFLKLDLPDERIGQILEPKPMPVPETEEDVVKEALGKPIDSAPLSELVRTGEKVCVIVGDMTRCWVRHHVFLPYLLDELNRGGIPDSDIFIISIFRR